MSSGVTREIAPASSSLRQSIWAAASVVPRPSVTVEKWYNPTSVLMLKDFPVSLCSAGVEWDQVKWDQVEWDQVKCDRGSFRYVYTHNISDTSTLRVLPREPYS